VLNSHRVEVFEAIAQPKRREILRLLAGGELSAGDVASRFEVTQPAISQHLKVLKEVGLVNERRDGARRLYSVRPEGLDDLHGFLADVLPGRLARLKRVVEEDQRRGGGGRRARRN
jgi:DNA-binding transcriptional ArsR family regulator